jgi:hypothetical protein
MGPLYFFYPSTHNDRLSLDQDECIVRLCRFNEQTQKYEQHRSWFFSTEKDAMTAFLLVQDRTYGAEETSTSGHETVGDRTDQGGK